jgi:hypothetical protein
VLAIAALLFASMISTGQIQLSAPIRLDVSMASYVTVVVENVAGVPIHGFRATLLNCGASAIEIGQLSVYLIADPANYPVLSEVDNWVRICDGKVMETGRDHDFTLEVGQIALVRVYFQVDDGCRAPEGAVLLLMPLDSGDYVIFSAHPGD